jgi:two-component system LytT family sensor kinase
MQFSSKSDSSRFWAFQFAGWAAYGLVSFCGALPYVGTVPHLDSVRSLAASRMAFVVVGIASTAVLRLVHQRDRRMHTSLVRVMLLVILSSYMFATVAVVAANLARYAAGGLYLGGWAVFGGTVTASMVFLAWNASYFAVNLRTDMEREKENALLAQAKAQEAQLAALRGQINPHSLFNALNSIQALIAEDHRLAQFAVERLAILLRYSLRQTNGGTASVSEELDGIGEYLALEKIRFEEKFVVAMEVEPGVEQVQIPGFLFHPLVENAIKHGMQTSAMPLRLSIRAVMGENSLRFEVSNTGTWIERERPLDSNPGAGIGLQLVRERLALAYPGHHRFERTSSDGWVTQRIEIQNIAGGTARELSSPAGR